MAAGGSIAEVDAVDIDHYADQLAPDGAEEMAMRQMNIAQAKAHLSELVQQALSGDEVVIARDGKPMVRLVPVVEKNPRILGLSSGPGFFMADDFDAPLDDFAEYM